MSSKFHQSGFTLVELIVVVGIIAVVMTVAATRLDFLIPEYRLRGAAREVGATMKRARTRAVGSGKDVYLEFDLSQNRYWILVPFPRESEEGQLGGSLRWEYQPILQRTLPDGVEFIDVVLSRRERISEGVARVWVSPLGSSNHVIVNLGLRNEDPIKAVQMNGFTGNLSFTNGYTDAKERLQDQ